MEFDDILFAVLVFAFVFLLGFNLYNSERIEELESKINGKCVYINNEFYCKD